MGRCELSPGVCLSGKYTVISVLGQGGFAITYLARDSEGNRLVAIKEFFWAEEMARDSSVSPEVQRLHAAGAEEQDAALSRFIFEGEVLEVLADVPFVARVLDTFRENGTAYIVMEHIAGRTLRQLLKGGPLGAEDAVRLLLPILDALSLIHTRGILHLDVRPENLILAPDGTLYLVDFGGARSLERRGQSQYGPMTKGAYSSPESFEGSEPGPWSDVYSICAVLYEALAGRPPESAVQRLFHDKLTPPSQLCPGLDPRLESVILRGLQLDRGQRYQDALSLSLALTAALLPAKKKSPWLYVLAGVLVLLCLAAGIIKYISVVSQPFYGVDSTEILFLRDYRTNDEEWDKQASLLGAAASELAGDAPSLAEADGEKMKILLPTETFSGRSIDETIDSAFSEAISISPVHIMHEQAALWQLPEDTAHPGEYQRPPEALTGETLTAVLSPGTYTELDANQILRAEITLKARLDALGIEYAFGYALGESSCFVLTLPLKDWGLEMLNFVGEKNFSITNSNENDSYLMPFHFIETAFDSDASSVTVTATDEDNRAKIEEFTEYSIETGSTELYFQTVYCDKFPWLEMHLSAPVTDGRLEFIPIEAAGEDGAALARFLSAAMASGSDMPDSFYLTTWETHGDDGLTGLYAVKGPNPDMAPDPAQLRTMDDFISYLSYKYYIQTVSFDYGVYVFPGFEPTGDEAVEFIQFVQKLLNEVNVEAIDDMTIIVANWEFFTYQDNKGKADCGIIILPGSQQAEVRLFCSGTESEAWLPALEEAWAAADFGDQVIKHSYISTEGYFA